MSLRYAARTRPGTMVSTWLNGLVSGTAAVPGGYFAGGYSTNTDAIIKFAFPDDTRTTLAATLTETSYGGFGFGNAGVAGYCAGGYGVTSGAALASVDKIAWPLDSKSTLGTGLAAAKYYGTGGFSNSGTAGYAAGGYTASAITDSVDKFAYSDDSRTTLSSGLATATYLGGTFANSGTAGYFGGGNTGSYATAVYKWAFSDDSRTTLGTGLDVAITYLTQGMGNSGVAGYFPGGYRADAPYVISAARKLTFSTDGIATVAGVLSVAGYGCSAFANSGTAGYVGGGNRSGSSAVVDKLTFSTDSSSALGTGLVTATQVMCGFANESTLV